MKKYFLLFVGVVVSNFTLAGPYKLDIVEDETLIIEEMKPSLTTVKSNLELMEPVKLRNPLNKKLGLEAGGPKYTKFIQSKPIIIIEQPVIQVDMVGIEDVVANPIVNVEHSPQILPLINNEYPVADLDKKANDIKEAKELLAISNGLSKASEIVPMPVITEAKVEVSAPALVIIKPEVVLKFKSNVEELSTDMINKILAMSSKIINNSDLNMKIISYYTDNQGRNIAFSRLLNTRKVLLEKSIPASQIMIMVLEDESENKVKNNSVEIFI